MRARSSMLVLLLALSIAAAPAPAAPPEVTGLAWCAGQTTCLQWDAASGATSYNLYRGEGAGLPCVVNPSLDSCSAGTYLPTTTGPTIVEEPEAGTMFWFLVTGVGISGEGSAGSGTMGPRMLNTSGTCAPTCRPAGAACFTNNDCCSANCNEVCQTSCCQPLGEACTTPAQCCEGACGGGVCGGPCDAPSDCPGSDTECATRTCVVGNCGVSNAPYGTPSSTQDPGDCQSRVCDGAGGYTSVPDDLDVQDDGNQCTTDMCVHGIPSHSAAPINTPCSQNGGTVCDGTGTCVQCTAPSQCPGSDTACQSRTCSAGACGFANAPMGTTCPDGACDGLGNCLPPPQVVATSPADGASVLASTSISVTFSTAMNPATLTGQTSVGTCSGSIQVSPNSFASCVAFSASQATMSSGNTVATLQPAPGLLVSRLFQIRVTTAAQNAAGGPLASTYTQPHGFTTTSPDLCDGSLVISQVYGGGGLDGASYRSDFVELHNRGNSAISVAGMSIQYASATGSDWSVTNLSGAVAANGFYLVGLSSAGLNGLPLPTPEATGATDLSPTTGKVALVSHQTPLTGICPTDAAVLDLVGYGATANCNEGGTNAPAPSVNTSDLRAGNGCGDVAANGSDFATGAPSPRNGLATPVVCSCIVRNESDTASEADFCVVQFPSSLEVQAWTSTGNIYGQLYEAGVTESFGPASQVRAQLGWGPASANPEYESGWTWINAAYNFQAGNNDEYSGAFIAPAPGSYRYVYRFSLDEGVTWTVCDTSFGDGGAGSNPGLTFDLENEGALTVTP